MGRKHNVTMLKRSAYLEIVPNPTQLNELAVEQENDPHMPADFLLGTPRTICDMGIWSW